MSPQNAAQPETDFRGVSVGGSGIRSEREAVEGVGEVVITGRNERVMVEDAELGSAAVRRVWEIREAAAICSTFGCMSPSLVMGSRLTPFGVAVVKEMNRLGMMVGVSHLSANGVYHVAEISTTPIVSTHQNLERFVKSRPQVEIMDEEAKAIAKTGGIVGIRYIVGVTPYKMLADEVEYLCNLIGPEHIGVGWLGHDKANPNNREVEGHLSRTYSGVEAQTQYEHWDNFIKLLSERGLTDEHIGMILGGNYLRIWRQILPAA